ncbi:MAG: HAD family hydrolase [Spirochaetales bacterium]
METVLIFDLDDTLILQDRMTEESVRYCTVFLGIDPPTFWQTFRKTSQTAFEALPSYDYCSNVGISAQEGLWGDFGGLHPALNQLRQSLAEYRFEAWSKALEVHGFTDDAMARSIADDFASLRGRRYYAFPEAEALLKQLKRRYTLAILTNGAPELQWSKVHKSGLEAYFDSVTVSGDSSIGKPRKEIFEVVFAKHPTAKRFVMIGNSLRSDIQGARNAGIPCVWYQQGDEPLNIPVSADATIRNLSELPSALQRLGL